jgi:protocatechuate 3,4-dioxygenase, beta subunit
MTLEHWVAERRSILRLSATAGALLPVAGALAQTARPRTPEQVMGPFYPMLRSEGDRNGDLTRQPGRPGRAQGQVLTIMGRVLNEAGEPVRGARVEVWQANAAGRYAHPSDGNPAPLDPNFEGFAALTTDSEGRYRFTTIKPGAYPAPGLGVRPPHIHFDVLGQANRLVTQMYFAGEPENERDRFLQSAGRKDLLIVALLPPPPELEPGSQLGVFDIVLRQG